MLITTKRLELDANGAVTLLMMISGVDKSPDPDKPGEGGYIVWASDGTGHGNEGDILMASTVDGETLYQTLYVHSAGTVYP